MTPLPILVVTLLAACGLLAAAYVRAERRCRRAAIDTAEARREADVARATLAERSELDSLKDEFVSNVSHELRTPLTSIRGALGLLSATLDGHIDAKSHNLLRIASSNTDRLVRLINDVLDLERMDSGSAPLQMHACALREIIQQSIDTMSSMADEAEVRLEVVPEPEVIAFEGDRDRMQQVLCNLLSNAIKFSPPMSVIRVLSGVDGHFLILRIEDQGRGVPNQNLETIFDRFQQVDPGDSRKKGGTGLGLAICRSILAQHNGTIIALRNDADSPTRTGTTFLIRMPRIATIEDLLNTSAIHRRSRTQPAPV